MADDIESKVLRYRSRLQTSTDEEKLQETLYKLADIPVTVDILQKTKIGKVVNGLRKKGGDLGFLAKSIVTEWKSMVARIQSKEEEEEENIEQSVAENPNTSPEVENNSESPATSPDVEEHTRSPNKKSGVEGDQKHKTNRHSSSHSSRSKGGKHKEPDRSSHSSRDKGDKHDKSDRSTNSSREKNERHSSSKEQKTSRDDKKNEERKQHSSTGDGKKSSSSNSKHSKSESSVKPKVEQAPTKSVKEENHKSHGSHSKTKDSQSNVEKSDKKDSKHSERKQSSRDSSKNAGHKHGHSSSESGKSESRHSEHKHASNVSNSKDNKTHNKHRDPSGSHSKQASSNSKSKNHHDKKSNTQPEENREKTRQDLDRSNKSDDKEVTNTNRAKRTLSDSDSENSVGEADVVNHSKVLGQWNGLISDGEMEDEPGGFFFNDDYVDHEALLNEALNKYHMEPQVPKREASSSVSDKKSHKLSSGDNPNKGKDSDSNKRKRSDDDKERSSSHKEKAGKDDSENRSHSSHKSSSSSKSSSRTHDREDRKRKREQDNPSESKKSRSSGQSKEGVSFEDSIGVPVKKPKADPNYEKLKSKFKIKKKGEASEEKKSKAETAPVKADTKGNGKVEIPTPGSRLRLSERDLAGLMRNNPAPAFHPLEENLSAVDQFDESMIGQKSYARTQVYSGKKNNGVLKVVSLQETCINLLMNHIDSIEAVGNSVPFYILEPVLRKCTPAQLYRLEDFNPHFLEDSDALWKFHCEREFRGSEPDEFESYRELYLRKFDEKEVKLKAVKDNISQSMAKAAPERTAKLAYIDSYVKPPREVRRQQLRYGTAGQSSGERSKKFAHLMDPIAIGRKERDDKAVRQKAPMMQKTMMMLKKMRK